MAAHAAQLARLFTPEYARRINAQIVHPAQTAVVKPNELESALTETLSYGLIKGHPFMDGNKRTAFFLANEYIRAMGIPGLADGGKVGEVYESVTDIAQRHIDVAAGKLEVEGLIGR